MILKKVFDGTVTTHTPLGSIDLSGYRCYSVLLRVEDAKSDTEPFRFTTYNNGIQVYQDDFNTTGGWYIHNVIHDIFHPSPVSFVLYDWKNEAKVKLWIYATCCTPAEIPKEVQVLAMKKVELTDMGIIR